MGGWISSECKMWKQEWKRFRNENEKEQRLNKILGKWIQKEHELDQRVHEIISIKNWLKRSTSL
jgi:hypothetical protein